MDDQDVQSGFWPMFSVVCTALILLVGTAALAREALISSLPTVGDVIVIRPRAEASRMVRLTVPVTRVQGFAAAEAGGTCALGTGALADDGGSLLVHGREADGGYLAHWAGAGRSAAEGTDCGRSADVRITEDEMATLRDAARGVARQPDPLGQSAALAAP